MGLIDSHVVSWKNGLSARAMIRLMVRGLARELVRGIAKG